MKGPNAKRASRAERKSDVVIRPQGGRELVSRMIPIWPLRTKVLLNYCEAVQVTSGIVATAGNYVFSANGMYDPNITGTGHQPSGFDQMSLFYNHFTVIRSKIIVDFRAITANYGGFVGVSLKADSTTVTNASQIVEDGLVEYKCSGVTGNWTAVNRLTKTADIAAFGGVVDLLDNSDYRGSSAANPVEQSYFHLHYWNELDNTAITVAATVLIEYEAVFSEPKPISQS